MLGHQPRPNHFVVWSNISQKIHKNEKKIIKNSGPKMSVEKFTNREGRNFSTDILGPKLFIIFFVVYLNFIQCFSTKFIIQNMLGHQPRPNHFVVWSNISQKIHKNEKKIIKNSGPKMSVEKFTNRERVNFSTDILGRPKMSVEKSTSPITCVKL